MTYYRMLACEVLFREICIEAAFTPNVVDVTFNRFGLHGVGSEAMLEELQKQVDSAGAETMQLS